MTALPDPVIPVIIPVQECAGKACDVPGWDWLWILLSCLGGFALIIILVIIISEWADL